MEFFLPRKFRLIYLPAGSLGLLTEDADIHTMFARVREHLTPDGLFLCSFELVRQEPQQSTNQWSGSWVRGPDNVVLAWRRDWRFDGSRQVWSCLFIIDKFVEGRLVETEANEREGRFFTVEQVESFARAAGFEIECATHELTNDPPRPSSDTVLLRCRKKRI